MTPELGHLALILALLAAVFQAGAGLVGARTRDGALMRASGLAALVQAGLVALAFAALVRAYLLTDLSVLNVYENSHAAKPFVYKLTGAWGNHEGSMLLWVLMLAVLGALVASFGRGLPDTLRARVVGVQAVIGVCFLGFALLTSNPFARLDPAPLQGTGLNPLLQDPGLAFHPPFLYLGYVGMSVAFSFAVAALIEGRITPAWARWVRPWTLLAWTSLTLGIAMGAWWAYYELGWGGYWFWDPVENASLMPWLAGTALLHSAIVVEKRDTLKAWCVLMAILAFSMSLLGAFIVRSGVLTSVHSFAADPARGFWLLVIFAVLTGGALTLFALRGGSTAGGGAFSSLSRESALVVNNVLLCVLTFTVLLGTFWPLGVEAITGERMSVGPPYFTIVTTPLMVLLAAALAAGVLLPWKRGRAERLRGRLLGAAIAAGLAGLAALYLSGAKAVLAATGLVIAVLIIAVSLVDLAGRTALFRVPPAQSLRRARGLPGAFWGGTLAHIGMGVAVIGMVGASLWLTEEQAVMQPGDTVEVAGLTVTFERTEQRRGPNYETEVGVLTLYKGGRALTTLEPEQRWYPVAQQATVEAAIVPRWAHDVYVAMGEPREDGRVIRVYHHPLVLWLWGGGLLMVAGGAISLTDRRYRVGAPARKVRQALAQAVPA